MTAAFATFVSPPKIALLLGAMLGPLAPDIWAATCTWNAAVPGQWHTPANWSDCAAGGGTPAGTPGPADQAVLPSGTGAALLNSQFTTISGLAIAPGAELGVGDTQIDVRQLTITGSLSLSAATLSGALPPPGGPTPALLSIQLPASAVLNVTGTNLFRRAIVTNAGVATFTGGSGVRLNLDLNGGYNNAQTGSTTLMGDYVLGYTTSGAISNLGTWINQGPGIVSIERSGADGGQFTSSGLFEILDATFKMLNPSAGFQGSLGSSSVHLHNGTFDGGTVELAIVQGKFLSGNGTIIGPFRVSGTLDLQAPDGGPYGVLNVLGNAQLLGPEVVLDIGGPAATLHDRLSVSGSAQWSQVRPRVRMLGGYAPGIDTGITIATHSTLVAPNVSIHDRVFSDYPLSLALRASTTQIDLRVVPTLTVADTEVIEGNSGSQLMQVAATLSAPTTQTVSFGYTTAPGTAVTVAAGGNAADYANAFGAVTFSPGTIAQQIPVTIHGDTSVEADEAFSIAAGDGQNSMTLQNASFGNNRTFAISSEGLIRDDDAAPGTRYLLIGKSSNLPSASGQISFVRRYTTAGVAVDGWATLMPNSFGNIATGFCRAPNGDVLSTRFSASQGPILMSASGAVLDAGFGGLIGNDESCAFDAQGNAWIGEAVSTSATEALLRHVAADGRILETVQVPVGDRGTDWIELDVNQCTIFYTSEDSDVRRFNVCTHQAMPNFASLPDEPCYAVRQLPNRDLMITCKNHIYRYDKNAVFVREYTRESLGETDSNGLYAIHLDPDGQTFWSGGVISGRVVRARLDDGTVVAIFTTGTGGINGLLIQGEFVAGIADVIFADGFEP
ncbi:MAG: Calx-beta domain-containing protein [Dokdonella sp.]